MIHVHSSSATPVHFRLRRTCFVPWASLWTTSKLQRRSDTHRLPTHVCTTRDRHLVNSIAPRRPSRLARRPPASRHIQASLARASDLVTQFTIYSSPKRDRCPPFRRNLGLYRVASLSKLAPTCPLGIHSRGATLKIPANTAPLRYVKEPLAAFPGTHSFGLGSTSRYP
jgi:hypothetical protein